MIYAITDNVLYDHLLYDITIVIMMMFVTLKEIPFHISSPSANPGNNKIYTSEQ